MYGERDKQAVGTGAFSNAAAFLNEALQSYETANKLQKKPKFQIKSLQSFILNFQNGLLEANKHTDSRDFFQQNREFILYLQQLLYPINFKMRNSVAENCR